VITKLLCRSGATGFSSAGGGEKNSRRGKTPEWKVQARVTNLDTKSAVGERSSLPGYTTEIIF